jgi:circadian clock protein KaiC
MNSEQYPINRIKTGIGNLDGLLGGGLPDLSLIIIGGSPGAGKTILSQQFCFANATPEKRVLFIQTLSEPMPKTLRYLRPFDYFDPAKLEDGSVQFVDLGGILRTKGLATATELMMNHLRQVKPAFVVIDSFKVFSELSDSREDLRKFSYEMAVNLLAWECTALLLGEFTYEELQRNPLSSIADGIVMLRISDQSGEHQRSLQIVKMRGSAHDKEFHPFEISSRGIDIFVPHVPNPEAPAQRTPKGGSKRIKTGMTKLDALLGDGIPPGSSILLSGVTGTGKTLLSLETLYRGATQFDEKGTYFSFDETPARLIAAAASMGWDLEREIKRGMIELVFVPQPRVTVEKHVQMICDSIKRFLPRRIVVDSLSMLFSKILDPRIAQEKTFHLSTVIQEAQAMGYLITDVPYGSRRISRLDVEETMVDGIIVLSSEEAKKGRERSLEVYKLRNSNHRQGRFPMQIRKGGITVKVT